MAGYLGPLPVPQATQTRETFTATASQTTFNTGGYTSGFIDVFMNGVKLAPADFTATNGSDVVLATGAAVGDIIEVVAYTAFEVLNQNFTGNTSTQDLTVSGNLTVTGTTITIDTATAQNVDLGDGDKIRLGDGDDLQIYHDGSRSIIQDSGTGNLRIQANNLELNNADNSKNYLFAANNGAVEIYYDNAKKFETTTSGVDVTGGLNTTSNVGVGTSSPSSAIHAVGGAGTNIGIQSTAGSHWRLGDAVGASDGTFVLYDYTNSAARLTVNSSGDVGIGTTAPQYGRLHISDGNSDIDMNTTASGQLHIDGNGYGFGIALNNAGAQLYTNSSSRGIVFGTNETERVRFKGGGGVQIKQAAQIQNTPTNDGNFYAGVGFENNASNHAYSIGYGQGGVLAFNHFDNSSTYTRIATLSSAGLFEPIGDIKFQSGKGISFSPTGQASGMSSETLDDYEEGTFTYTLVGSTSGGWTSRTGYATARYTKIGQLVSVQIRFESGSRNSPQGDLRINGLPFATAGHPSGGNGSGQVPVLLRGNSDSSVASHFVSYGNSATHLTFFTQDQGQSSISSVNAATHTTGNIEGTIQFSYVTGS